MTAAEPLVSRCGRCGGVRPVSAHRSARDGLVRALCTPCWSHAATVEAAGHRVMWGGPRHGEGAPGQIRMDGGAG